MKRNVNVITDLEGKKIVVIQDIIFYGKQNIDWGEVEAYLKKYVDEYFQIVETGDVIYIGKDLPYEYAGSEYTAALKGGLAKAKANAAQGIPELVRIARNKRHRENLKKKHKKDAKRGWYRYDTRFALPIYDNGGELVRYNIFNAELLVRHDADGQLYLYDIINIKKKQSTPFE